MNPTSSLSMNCVAKFPRAPQTLSRSVRISSNSHRSRNSIPSGPTEILFVTAKVPPICPQKLAMRHPAPWKFGLGHDLSTEFWQATKFQGLEMGQFLRHTGCMATFSPLEPLLDARAASAMLGIHCKTVQMLARQGRLPGIRYARHWHFRRKDLISWVERQLPSSALAPTSDPSSPPPPDSVPAS